MTVTVRRALVFAALAVAVSSVAAKPTAKSAPAKASPLDQITGHLIDLRERVVDPDTLKFVEQTYSDVGALVTEALNLGSKKHAAHRQQAALLATFSGLALVLTLILPWHLAFFVGGVGSLAGLDASFSLLTTIVAIALQYPAALLFLIALRPLVFGPPTPPSATAPAATAPPKIKNNTPRIVIEDADNKTQPRTRVKADSTGLSPQRVGPRSSERRVSFSTKPEWARCDPEDADLEERIIAMQKEIGKMSSIVTLLLKKVEAEEKELNFIETTVRRASQQVDPDSASIIQAALKDSLLAGQEDPYDKIRQHTPSEDDYQGARSE